MCKSLLNYLFILLLFIVSCAPISAQPENERYDIAHVFSLRGGFPETIEKAAALNGLSLDAFYDLQSRTPSAMTADNFAKMTLIRKAQIRPDASVLMQKVISGRKIEKYLDGTYVSPRGFVSVCADIVHYRTISDFYYGLRLDYEGTDFKPDSKSIGIIRFKALNAGDCIVPLAFGFGGSFKDKYPFGGHGFTAGINHRLGTPEWFIEDNADLLCGQIFEFFDDGTEILIGIYNREKKCFERVKY